MIIFFYGSDTYRSSQKLNELKSKYIKEIDSEGESLFILDGENLNMESINEAIAPVSLFSKKRMIIIRNIFSNKKISIFKELYEYLIKNEKKENKNKDDNIIVFYDQININKTKKKKNNEKELPKDKKQLFNYLVKQKYSYFFDDLNYGEIILWIKKQVELKKGKISNEAASLLASLIGKDLWQINNEIEKLLNYKLKTEEKNIKIIDINELVYGNYDENIFNLTDAISNKNKSQAIMLLEKQIESGADETAILAMIVWQFRILLQIREALDIGFTSRKIINTLKLNPIVAQKNITQVRNYSTIILKKIYKHLLKIEYYIKSDKGDLKTMLGLLIAKL